MEFVLFPEDHLQLDLGVVSFHGLIPSLCSPPPLFSTINTHSFISLVFICFEVG